MSPCWHLSYLKKCNIVFYHSIPYLLLRTGPTPERTKTTLTTIESDINITTISPIIQRHSTYTKSHRPFTWAWSSSIWYSQSNHHKWDSHITSGKICYSLIEPQLLSSTLAYSHKVHALAFHPHPTFAAPLGGSAFKIRSVVCGGAFFAETVNLFRSLTIYAEEFHCWCLATLSQEVSSTRITQGNLELLPPNSPDSHQTQIQ